jgi:hypothetical protein
MGRGELIVKYVVLQKLARILQGSFLLGQIEDRALSSLPI